MRRRTLKVAVGIGVSVFSVTGLLASPAWAPKITLVPVTHSVDDCKNGGWARFREYDYKNQGQCVSAAARSR